MERSKTQLVYWCKQCGTTLVVTMPQTACGLCQGDLKEIGWVEETNGYL